MIHILWLTINNLHINTERAINKESIPDLSCFLFKAKTVRHFKDILELFLAFSLPDLLERYLHAKTQSMLFMWRVFSLNAVRNLKLIIIDLKCFHELTPVSSNFLEPAQVI